MSFRLAHISDLHLPPPADTPWHGLAAKRLLSRLAWAHKKRRHPPQVLAQVIADVQARGVDHIAITGDLTNFSTHEEFAAARAWLQDLAACADVTVSPGNHDALAGRGGPERFAGWSPWLGDDDALQFPKVRVRAGVALVNLCSARPTALHLAQGELGDDQLARLDAVLGELGAAGLYRVLLVHHPVTPGVVKGRKDLRDRTALAGILRRRGAELVLHGHAHEAALSALPGPTGPIPVLGVPSASAVGGGHDSPARWNEVEIDPRARTARITAHGLAAGGVRPLGAYVLPRARAA